MLIACLDTDQMCINDSPRDIVLEVEQEEHNEYNNRMILNYLNNNQRWFDFEQANNFVKSSNNRYLHNQDNLSTLALDNMLHYLRLCPDCCLEFSFFTLP